MPPRTLYEFLDRAMNAMHTDAVKLGKDLGIDDSWIRNLKNGRIKNDPDPVRMAKLAAGLKIDEAELWRYLGRMDKVAELRGEPLRGDQEPMPEWARRLELKLDAISDRLQQVDEDSSARTDGLTALLRELRDQFQTGGKQAGRGPKSRPGAARPVQPEPTVEASRRL